MVDVEGRDTSCLNSIDRCFSLTNPLSKRSTFLLSVKIVSFCLLSISSSSSNLSSIFSMKTMFWSFYSESYSVVSASSSDVILFSEAVDVFSSNGLDNKFNAANFINLRFTYSMGR